MAVRAAQLKLRLESFTSSATGLQHRIRPYRIRFSTRSSSISAQSGADSSKITPRRRVGRMVMLEESNGRKAVLCNAGGGLFQLGFGRKPTLPEIVQAGDPVLHEPAGEVPLEDIGSSGIEKIIDDMVAVMREAPGVGLAAPQIGIPLQIIVLEDTEGLMSYSSPEEVREQQRNAFDLLVGLNSSM